MRGVFDDLPLVRLPLEAWILRRVVRAPGECEVERDPERNADAIFGAGPVLAGTVSFHAIDASNGRSSGTVTKSDKTCRIIVDRGNPSADQPRGPARHAPHPQTPLAFPRLDAGPL